MKEVNRRDLLKSCSLVPGGIAFGASAVAIAASGDSAGAAQRSALLRGWAKPGGTVASRRFPNCYVTTQDGKRFRFYDDLIRDKVVMINFFYSECKKFCPPMTANLAKVQTMLGSKVGKEVFMYSLTLQPEEDTPKVLKSYMAARHVMPGWTFLTGSLRDMETLRVKLGFRDSLPDLDRDIDQHTGMVLFGNDRLNRWTACPALTHPKELVRELSWLEA